MTETPPASVVDIWQAISAARQEADQLHRKLDTVLLLMRILVGLCFAIVGLLFFSLL